MLTGVAAWIPMPYKFNESRRHKIPKARYRVTNWPEYDAALHWPQDLRRRRMARSEARYSVASAVG